MMDFSEIFPTLLMLVLSYFLFLKLYSFSRLPPGPWGLPLIGYLPFLNPKAPHESLHQVTKKYGSICGIQLGYVYTVLLTNPKDIRQLFSKDATTGRAPLYLTHGIMNGYGLICSEGDLWKDQRRFTYNCLRQLGGTKVSTRKKKMESLIHEYANDFVNQVKSLSVDGQLIFDPTEELRHSIGSIMNRIVFGKSWSRSDATWKWLQHLQEKGTQLIGVAGPMNFLPFLKFFRKFSDPMKFILEGKYKTHDIYKKIIKDNLDRMDKERIENDGIANFIEGFLLERNKRNSDDVEKFYNDEQFHHLLADIFGAGLDTTLTTLRWYLLYIAQHSDVQALVRSELQQSLDGDDLSIDLLPSMPYLEASIAETQRIRSVVPMGLPHGTLEDISINGYVIPKGTMLVPLQWAIHMNEKLFSDPEHFNPGRFIDSEGKFIRSDNLLPFQVGKRMCVGDELARMLLVHFIGNILTNFDVVPESTVDFEGVTGITLNPKVQNLVFKSL